MSVSPNGEAAERLGASWPDALAIRAWERQWQKDGNAQKQESEEAATSSETINKQKEEKALIETIQLEDSSGDEDDVTTIGIRKEPPIHKLIHSRELLQKVICPWELIQQFVNISDENFLNSINKCLVAFRVVQQKEGCEDSLATELYIDEISEFNKDKVMFKHYGSFEFHSIRPNYCPITNEDFDKWLDMLINEHEGLPKSHPLRRNKKGLNKELDKAISLSIFRRHLLPNPLKLFDGIVGIPPIMPLFIDIAPIILQIEHLNKLLKFSPTDFVNILPGLCIQVDITQIKHTMKLPPLMTLLKYMLMPISFVTLDSPIYRILQIRPFRSNVMLHSFNGNGHLLCSFQIPQQMLFPSEQLIQISLSIWAMNDIPMPTSEHIQRKAAQFRDALIFSENIHIIPLDKKSNILPTVQLPLQQMIHLEHKARRNRKKRKRGNLSMNNDGKNKTTKCSMQNIIRLT